MSNVTPKYSKDEFARRGEEIYENDIRPQLQPEDNGKLVAIDIESGAWELGTEELDVADRLRERHPQAQTWMRRVGKRSAVHRFGFRSREAHLR